MKRLLDSLLILFLIINCFGCAPTPERYEGLNYTPVEIPPEIIIIINDESIKGHEFGNNFTSKLEDKLKKHFDNVVIKTGSREPKINEIIITPQEPPTFSGSFEIFNQTKEGVWQEGSIPIKVKTCRYETTHSFTAKGQYYPSLIELWGGVAASIATLSGSMIIQETMYYSIAKHAAMEQLAEKIADYVVLDKDFSSYVNKAKFLLTEAAQLDLTLSFSDRRSLLPNQVIDASEECQISAKISNHGSGTAFAVKLTCKSASRHISFPDSLNIGDIQPGEEKVFTLNLSADPKLTSGTASFLITATEKRGYNSRPVELQIPTAKLMQPDFVITSCDLKDAAGLAVGDGDGIPENNETIEIVPFIENHGTGDGLQVSIRLDEVSEGIEIIKRNDKLAAVGRYGVNRGSLAFKIPQTYAAREIHYTVSVTDIRGMSTKKSYSLPFQPQFPMLTCSYQVFDTDNREVSELKNGEQYLLKIVPGNSGKNSAENVKVDLATQSKAVDIGYYNHQIGNLAATGRGEMITIPLKIDRAYTKSELNLALSINQDNFPKLNQTITLPMSVSRPQLSRKITLLNSRKHNAITQNSWPKFRVSVNNNGSLEANDVSIRFSVSHPSIDFVETKKIGTIKAGQSQYKDFSFFVRGDAERDDLKVEVSITQADFADISDNLTYRILPQTAIIQKVEPINASKSIDQTGYEAPPQLFFNSPNNNLETYEKEIALHGSILFFGPGNALEKLTVKVNGKRLPVTPVSEPIRLGTDQLTRQLVQNKITLDGRISLVPENNRIEILCTDRNNRQSKEIIQVTRKARLGDIYAVIIGISHFQDSSCNLKYAASDAKKFANFLHSEAGGNLPEHRTRLLTNENATRAAVIGALTNFLGRAGRDDTIEIYLATHGIIDNRDAKLYYLAYNSDIKNLRGTAFSNDDLEEIVGDNIHAGKVIVYLDACHSGLSGLSGKMFASRSVAVVEVNRRLNNLAAQLSKSANGVATFSASSANGYSLEDSRWQGGIFTHFLLKGLQGDANYNQNEWITIGELERYLTQKIILNSEGRQTPKLNNTLHDDTPIAKVSDKK